MAAGCPPAAPRGDHPPAATAQHWDEIYATRDPDQLSWSRVDAGISAEIIARLAIGVDDPIIDVGGGAGVLVDHLLAVGHRRITVLDASERSLRVARDRLERAGAPTERVEWTVADVCTWQAPWTYGLWHDRAVFHFLTAPADRARYRARTEAAVAPGGFLVIGTFAADGPTRCSGLPVAGYDPDELAAQFSPAFNPVSNRSEYHRTPQGAEQHFTWLVLQRHGPGGNTK